MKPAALLFIKTVEIHTGAETQYSSAAHFVKLNIAAEKKPHTKALSQYVIL